jgi:NAD(P)-dependent dehydrogenase (short-subunit alcohol dehydrogenase family)
VTEMDPAHGGGRLVVGLPIPQTQALAGALASELVAAPTPPAAARGDFGWGFVDELAAWTSVLRDGPPVDAVVVCTWMPPTAAGALADLGADGWMDGVEWPMALWFSAVQAAADRCADGGSIVVVVERPAPIDSHGRATTTAVAEALGALVRSVALIHGPRGVRANVVATEIDTAPEVLLGLSPALATFPGTPAREVAGAVRMLLGVDAVGVTGTVVRADCGRSW